MDPRGFLVGKGLAGENEVEGGECGDGPASSRDVYLLRGVWDVRVGIQMGRGRLGASDLGPSQEKATLGAAPPKVCPAQSLAVPPNCGQKLWGEKLLFPHLIYPFWGPQILAVGPEAWLPSFFSLFSFFALPVRTYSR